MTRPGYKTTEFWFGLVAILVAALLAADVFAQGSTLYKLVTAAGLSMNMLGYGASRMTVKAARAELAQAKAPAPEATP